MKTKQINHEIKSLEVLKKEVLLKSTKLVESLIYENKLFIYDGKSRKDYNNIGITVSINGPSIQLSINMGEK